MLSAQGRLFILGDSLSDTGNVDRAFSGQVPGPAYFDGRFSNGPIWIDTIAAELGFTADARASLDGGRNFAVGGAETSALQGQLGGLFLAEGLTFRFAPDDLVVIWIGGNDLLNNPNADPATMVQRIEAVLNSAFARGARRFLVNNLPDLAATPDRNQEPAAEKAALTMATRDFNMRLAMSLEAFRLREASASVASTDIFTILEQVQERPAPLGLTNLAEQALGQTNSRREADRFVFWDNIHPTTVTHTVIARAALIELRSEQAFTLAGTALREDRLELAYFGDNTQGDVQLQTLSPLFQPIESTAITAGSSGLIFVDVPITGDRGIFRLQRATSNLPQ